MYLNQVMLIGNLTRDPELRALPSGVQVASFGLATNETYTDKQGQKQESVEFHNVVVWGRQAETTAQYMKKGSQLMVIGKLRTSSWEQDGVKRYKTEVVAQRVIFGRNPNGGDKSYQKTEAELQAQQAVRDFDNAPEKPQDATTPTIEYPADDIDPNDIPF